MGTSIPLYLVRHAESEANARGIISGSVDVALSTLGVEQAKTLRDFFANVELSHVHTSALRRAKQTAELAVNDDSIPVMEHTWLNERRWGVFEGVPIRIYRELIAAKEIRSEDFVPEEGESLPELVARVEAGIANFTLDGPTAFFAHHSSVKALLKCLCPNEFPRWDAVRIPNATPLCLYFDPEALTWSFSEEVRGVILSADASSTSMESPPVPGQ